jgi:predicted nucleotidyltransferase
LKLILLYGSYSKGEGVEGNSDLDIAVLPRDCIGGKRFLALHKESLRYWAILLKEIWT